LTYSNQELEGMENCIGIQSPQQTVVQYDMYVSTAVIYCHTC